MSYTFFSEFELGAPTRHSSAILPTNQKEWQMFYSRTDTYSIGAIGLFLLGKNPKELKEQHGDDDNGRRDLKMFNLISDEKGTEEQHLVAAIARLLTRDPWKHGTLQAAEKVFNALK